MLTVDIIRDIIESMKPLVRVSSIEDVVVDEQWKLNICQTYWLRELREIEIDGSAYIIDEVKHNEYIIISPLDGALKPTILKFTMYAPSFYFGTHKKVNQDRTTDGNLDNENGFDAITPFAMLLSRIAENEPNTDDTSIDREADIRLFFLEKYDIQDDTTNDNLLEVVIRQLHSMADYFIAYVNGREDLFNMPENISRRTYEAFSEIGLNNAWYLDDSLAAVELDLTLPILKTLGCDCKDVIDISCAPVTMLVNGVEYGEFQAGSIGRLIVKDQEGNEVGSLINNEWIVNTGSMVQGEVRTGSSLKFDNFIGASYNPETPSDSATITIDETDSVVFGQVVFYNDGTVEPTISITDPNDLIVVGSWQSGKLNAYYGYWDSEHYVIKIEALEDYTPPLPPVNILFEDDFTGTTIDPAKWDLTNPNSSNVTFTQNGNLTIASDGTNSLSAGANFLLSDDVWDLSTTKAFSFDLASNNQDCYGGWVVGLSNGVDNYIVIYNGSSASGNNIRMIAAESASIFINTADIALPISASTTFKVLVTATETSISYWNGSVWVSIVSASHTWSANDLKIRLAQGNNVNDTAPNLNTNVYDNVYITDGDFLTRYPV